jgi:hypothetical protein
LFGVSYGIQDITRSFGMVRRLRTIYGKFILGFRKSSRLFWYCIRKILEGCRGSHNGPHLSWRAHIDQGVVHRPTWRSTPGSLGHAVGPKGMGSRDHRLVEEMSPTCSPALGLGGARLATPPYQYIS